MATISDSIAGDEYVMATRLVELTISLNLRDLSLKSHEARVEAFLRRVLPVVSDNATNPEQVLAAAVE